MDLSFGAVVQWGIDVLTVVNEQAATMDGRAAFVLGVVTWFLIEQAIRRLAGLLRIAIIVGALGAAGLGVAAYVASVVDDVDLPGLGASP